MAGTSFDAYAKSTIGSTGTVLNAAANKKYKSLSNVPSSWLTTGGTTTTKTSLPDPNAGKILGADGVWRTPDDNHNYVHKLGKYAIPDGDHSSGGGSYSLPAYKFPSFNIGIPDLSWMPTEEQKGNWLQEAIKRAALQVDPQVQGREQGYTRFENQANQNISEINPQYDRASMSIANVFKNAVVNALTNAAIRRGAETSGWLPEETAKLGREEAGQRREVENERSQVLNSIRNQVLAKRQETDDALQALEAIRGKQQDVTYADLERLARSDFLTEKQGTFENQLQKAIFEGGYATDKANYLLNRFGTLANAELAKSQLGLDERKTSLQEALTRYQMTPTSNYSKPETLYTVNIGGQNVPLNTSQYLSYYGDVLNAQAAQKPDVLTALLISQNPELAQKLGLTQ
jgi:flagellar motility protein MotE (MotC chaperone)